jgi:hypothetical protein
MAIQVNGTQVIGNSRELTNIASVDATTAASITAAGVGGSSFTAGNTYLISRFTQAYQRYLSNTTYAPSAYPLVQYNSLAEWSPDYPRGGICNVGGTLRLSGYVSSAYTYAVMNWRILKNGSQYGSERSHQNTVQYAPTAFTWDIAVSAGDLIEIQGKNTVGYPYDISGVSVLSGTAAFGGFLWMQ